MHTILQNSDKIFDSHVEVFLVDDFKQLSNKLFSDEEINFIKNQKENAEKDTIIINKLTQIRIVHFYNKDIELHQIKEKCRIAGDKICNVSNEYLFENLVVTDLSENKTVCYALVEGISLSNYQFIKYKSKQKQNTLKNIFINNESITNQDIVEILILTEAVYKCKDLVNEPLTFLNAVKFSEIMIEMGKNAGFKVEVFDKRKIESLKMGGLLAVNRGSIDPPTFSILEYKPENAINEKPYVFVGKGVVYDTGGVNIKPGDYMLDMKCDMGGAAAVASAIFAIAKSKLPVYVIGLIPATDNRPDGNAYVPGDVLTMFTGKTVEVMNTDAEGRLILADALGFASKYNPELVINIATLTGAASRAIGSYGIVAMQAKAEKEFDLLKQSGYNVYERLAEFPFWDEYNELIKSDVADIKNLGGAEAGMITAGKFLYEFTDYPFIHLDIAGPVYLSKRDSYRGKSATGCGVRLFFDFIKNKI